MFKMSAENKALILDWRAARQLYLETVRDHGKWSNAAFEALEIWEPLDKAWKHVKRIYEATGVI